MYVKLSLGGYSVQIDQCTYVLHMYVVHISQSIILLKYKRKYNFSLVLIFLSETSINGPICTKFREIKPKGAY